MSENKQILDEEVVGLKNSILASSDYDSARRTLLTYLDSSLTESSKVSKYCDSSISIRRYIQRR
jgi:hypothetical protein